MRVLHRPRIDFIKSLQPTPEAAMSRLARLRRKQRLLLHDRKVAKIANAGIRRWIGLSEDDGSQAP